MKKGLFVMFLLVFLATPASALEITAPEVPEAGAALMPEDTSSFGEALTDLLRAALGKLRPDLEEAARMGVTAVCAAMLLSVVQPFAGTAKKAVLAAGTLLMALTLLESAGSLIRLGAETVTELGEYGKLLLPVMTAALAATGGAAASAALYAGTAAGSMVLGSLISRLLVPLVYLFLALAAANCAAGEEILKKFRDMVRSFVSWSLKTLLTVYTTYMGLTGVVSGTTDAVALKATKMTISSMVPVVGGILSDASEAVLVSGGLLKNAAGIYGILAALAVFASPFLRIWAHYVILKVTAAVCGLFSPKRLAELIGDFSAAMGLLLAMTGSECLLILISTICFMKGTG